MLSKNYKNWVAILDLKTCAPCRKMNGQIYEIGESFLEEPPVHMRCRCRIERMKARLAGTATLKQKDGADWYLKHMGKLPNYYITTKEARAAGWQPMKGNLHLTCPGQMIIGGLYENVDGHLPTADGRIWYEADINYSRGYRGSDRIVFSSDGLIFVTYNHYATFEEII